MRTSHRPPFRARFLAPRYWATWLIFALCGFLCVVPMRARNASAALVLRLLRRLPNRRRHIARVNLGMCYPELSQAERERLLQRHALSAAAVLLDYGRLMFRSPAALDRCIDVYGLDNLETAAGSGRGVIVLTPHSTAFEQTGQWLNQRQPLLGVVRLHADNEVMDWMVTRMRTRHGAEVVSHLAGTLTLVKAVRDGRWLYYLPDEDPGPDAGVFAPFLGVPKATVASLGRLANAGRALVLPMASGYCPERGRYWVRLLEPVEWGPVAEPFEDAARTNRLLERLIEIDPAQYMWSNKIFRSRPDGARKPY
ncbi:MAG: hypothetical protein RIC56_16585 [Pseudomonadales bacterium]